MSKTFLIMFSMVILFTLYGSAVIEGNEQKNKIDNVLKFVEESKEREVSSIEEYRRLQEKNRLILLVSITVTTIFFLFLVLLFMTRNKNCTAGNIVNGTGLVLVIQAILFVVIGSPTTEQMSAAIGALGAIAGYLFGRATTRDSA